MSLKAGLMLENLLALLHKQSGVLVTVKQIFHTATYGNSKMIMKER